MRAAEVQTSELFADYRPKNQYTIPFFPHLKKFIKVQYGMNPRKPIQVDEYTPVGRVVMLSLRDKRQRAEYNDQYRDKLTSEISLLLTKEMLELSPQQSRLMKINIYIDDLFKSHMITWIHSQTFAGIPAYTACRNFLAFHGIEEKEYSLDAAYKYWQRWTKEQEEKKK